MILGAVDNAPGIRARIKSLTLFAAIPAYPHFFWWRFDKCGEEKGDNPIEIEIRVIA